MATTRNKLVKLAREQAANGGFYVWGASGQKNAQQCLNNWDWVRSMENSNYTGSQSITTRLNNIKTRINNVKNQGKDLTKALCFDCSGLICGCYGYITNGKWGNHFSSSGPLGHDGAYSTLINANQAIGGDFLWRKGHIGIYIGNGRVVHAYGREPGVIEHSLAASGSWSEYRRPKSYFYGNDLNYSYEETTPGYVEKKYVTLNFDARNQDAPNTTCSISPTSKTFEAGTNMGVLPRPTCSDSNWTFSHWYVIENGVKYQWFDNTSCGTITPRTLYAKYTYNNPQKYPVITNLTTNKVVGNGSGNFTVNVNYTGYTTTLTRYCPFDKNSTARKWTTITQNKTGADTWTINAANLEPWNTNWNKGVRTMVIHTYNKSGTNDTLVGGYEYQITQQVTLDFNGGVRADNNTGSITGYIWRNGNSSLNGVNLTAGLVNTHGITIGTKLANMMSTGANQTWLTRKGYTFAGLSINKNSTSGTFNIKSATLNIAVNPNYPTSDKVTWFAIWKPQVIICNIYGEQSLTNLKQIIQVTGANDFKFNPSISTTKTGYTFRGFVCDAQKLSVQAGSTLASTLAGRTLNFYTQFTPNNYTLYFYSDTNQGIVNKTSISVTYDASYASQMSGVVATPKKNYTFIGWKDSSGNMVTSFSKYQYAKNETFTAVFSYTPPPQYHNYYYDANGNLISSMTQVGEVGASYTIPSSYLATPIDSKWKGWNYNGSLYQTGASVPIISQDRHFYATYEKIIYYTVTFNLTGGSYNGSTSNIVISKVPEKTSLGSMYPNINNVKRNNYYFVGFKTSAGAAFTANTIINSNITVNAEWDEALGKMTLHYNDRNDTVKEVDIRVNTTYYIANSPEFTIPSTMSKTGYEAGKWYSDSALTKQVNNFKIVSYTDNPHFYLEWRKKAYRISYKCNYASLSFNAADVFYQDVYGDFPKVTPSPGYRFDNWYADAAYTIPVSSSTKIENSNVTVYGRCLPEEYTITYDWNCKNPNGVATPSPQVVKYGQSIPNTPNGAIVGVNIGYGFRGWYDSAGKQIVPNSMYTYPYDITAYAKWEKLPYQIQLYERKNKLFGSPITVLYDESIPKDIPIPVRSGATFLYWQDKATGEEFDFNSRMPNYNISLEAVWHLDLRADAATIINKVGRRLMMTPMVWNNNQWKSVKIYVYTNGEWCVEQLDPNNFIDANK